MRDVCRGGEGCEGRAVEGYVCEDPWARGKQSLAVVKSVQVQNVRSQ